jgi:hypothetical protein
MRSGLNANAGASRDSNAAFTISSLELQVASLQRQVQELKNQLASASTAAAPSSASSASSSNRGDAAGSLVSGSADASGAIRARPYNEALCFLSAVSSNHYDEFLQFIISLR